MFTKLKGIPFMQLEEDENFLSHSLQVMEAISLAISCLDDVGELTEILKILEHSHGSHSLVDAHFDVSECTL